MKKYLAAWFGVSLLVLLAGCATSEAHHTDPVPEQMTGKKHPVLYNLEVSNSGVFLFNLIPIYSGSPTEPNRRQYNTFNNDLSDEYMYEMLYKWAKYLGADEVEDIKLGETRHIGLYYSVFILWRRDRSATGCAVKLKKTQPSSPAKKLFE